MPNIMNTVRMLFQRPNRSIGTKLFLIFFCSLGVSVIGMGLFSSHIAENAIIDQMKKSSQDLVTTAGEKLDMKQQFYIDLSNQLNSLVIAHLLKIYFKFLMLVLEKVNWNEELPK